MFGELKMNKIKAYLTLTIPAAMLARIVRFVTGVKGTKIELLLMSYYYKMEKKLLGALNE